jgi:hypothetical protein
MALLSKQGYGQLEPNFLVAQRTGEVFAQLPFVYAGVTLINSNSFNAIEQGMFLKYDYAGQKVTLPSLGGDKLTFLHMSEIRLFGPFLTNKDFALFPSPTDATSSYVSTGIIPGLAQSANQILNTTGNLVINVNSSPTGFTAASYVQATVTFNDGSGTSTYTFTNTGTTTAVFTTGTVHGTFFLTGDQINAIQFTTTDGIYPVISNKSVTGIEFTGVNGATTPVVTGSVYINTAIATASTFTSTAVGNAYGQQVVYPRLYKPSTGDVITTNLLELGALSDIAVGQTYTPGINGVLGYTATGASTALLYKVVAVSTTPDLQKAAKLQCIQTP